MFQSADLVQACQVLFGDTLRVDQAFLLDLEHSLLKRAYRKRALAVHPDRFARLGTERQALQAQLFRETTDAYQRLNRYLSLRTNGARFHGVYVNAQTNAWRRSRSVYTPPPVEAPPRDARVYTPSRVPTWPLRTGEFLYFSGVVLWKDLIASLVWQRRQRECLGEIARRWGWLSEDEVIELLADRRRGERLGEILLRHGIVTPFQVTMLLRHQERTQKQLGRYFVERRLVSEAQLWRYLRDLQAHNVKWRRPWTQ